MDRTSVNDVHLIAYRPDLREDFARLNLPWLEEHALLEPLDLEYLHDPEGKILAGGGQVFFAVRESIAIGTCAAIRISAHRFELAKLAVDASARGAGIGRRLCEAVIGYARQNGASELVLTSHTSLSAAIQLYESLGFRHEPLPPDVAYETANVFMRMTLGVR